MSENWNSLQCILKFSQQSQFDEQNLLIFTLLWEFIRCCFNSPTFIYQYWLEQQNIDFISQIELYTMDIKGMRISDWVLNAIWTFSRFTRLRVISLHPQVKQFSDETKNKTTFYLNQIEDAKINNSIQIWLSLQGLQ